MGTLTPSWWVSENSVFSLAILLTVDNRGTDNGSVGVESGKNLT